MQKIKLNKSQQSLLMLGNCIYEPDGVYYCYLPFYFKSTKNKNTFELIYLNNIPDELKELIHIYKKDEIMSKELDELQKDIALNFLMYVESEYYQDCGSWHNKDTQEYKHRQDIYDEFIKQYKYDGN